MKKLILVLLIACSFSKIHAILPPGVTQLDGKQAPFLNCIFEDSHKRTWVTFSRMLSSVYRSGNGYGYYDSAYQFHKVSSTGIFLDVIEFKKDVFITHEFGLFRHINDSVVLYPEFDKSSELTEFRDSVFVGTFGNGLKIWKDGKAFTRNIKINGVSYDTIISVFASGNTLWLGTNKGVVKYENGQYKLMPLPAGAINPNIYNSIRSVVVDGRGNVWCANDVIADTIPNLFLMLKGTDQWIPAQSHFKDQCLENRILPNSFNRLVVARNGSVLIATLYGVIELNDNSIHCFPVLDDRSFYNYNIEWLRMQNPYYVAMEDKDGNYQCINLNGYYKIDRLQYDIESLAKSLDGTHSHVFSTMDFNDVQAGVANDGTLFNGSDMFYKLLNGKTFTMPQIKCTQLLFNSTLWVAAHSKSTGENRVAVMQYRQRGSDFSPGPVNQKTPEFDSGVIRNYNRIWRMDKIMIDEFKAKFKKDPNYVIPEAILDWPGNNLPGNNGQLAPYMDVDNDAVYSPQNGDYPLIKGDRMLWWVFNDLADHTESGDKPLGIQVKGSCYAFRNLKSNPKDSDYLINRTLFFRYEVMYCGYETFDSVKIGIFVDPDIGDYTDDGASCDSVNRVAYAFNGDNFDNGPYGLGKNPPLVAVKFLNKPLQSFIKNSPKSSLYINTSREFYALLNNSYLYNDSVYPMPEHYADPVPPCQYSALHTPVDTRFLMVTSMDLRRPGQQDFIDWSYSVLYDPNTDYLTQKCNEPLAKMQMVQRWYDNNTFPSHPYWTSDVKSLKTFDLKIYPNPAGSFVQIQSSEEMSEVTLMDISGKEILSVQPGSAELSLPLPSLQTGIYLIKIVTRYGTRMEKLLVH